jgi:tetratricopeptide (TPR) repeat protein
MTDQDARALLEAGKFEDVIGDEHPLWRGLALLELKRFADAARVFEEAEGMKESSSMLELAGAARWLAGEREAAAEHWITALEAGSETPADAVRAPALLLYAGVRLGDDRYVRRGTRLLGKLWKPKLSRRWPGPVAGFLLGEVEESAFIDEGFEDPALEARRRASAHFWAALRTTGEESLAHYRAAVDQEGPGVLEVEHHLAHGELSKSGA